MRVTAGRELFNPIRVLVAGKRLPLKQDIFQMSAPSVAAFISCQSVEHRRIGRGLPIHVERGVYTQSTSVDFIRAVLIFQILPYLLNEIRGQRVRIMRNIQPQRRIAGSLGLRNRDLSIFEHRIDHQSAPVHRVVRMIDRRIIKRRFREARDQRCFWKRELPGGLAEIVFRRRLESIYSVAKINLVGVESEDLLLSKTAFDLDS